jgi:membrane fusion protein (multidrug efflux system)
LQVLLTNPGLHIVIEESAIAYSPYGQYVYVVAPRKNSEGRDELDAEGKPLLIAEQRLVETGERRDGTIVIAKGLAKGEQVVTAGQIKLQNGTPVRISIHRNQPDERPLAAQRENDK